MKKSHGSGVPDKGNKLMQAFLQARLAKKTRKKP